MVAAMVYGKNPGSDHWEGMDRHEFAVFPRLGERIDFVIDGTAYSYEVVAVHHSAAPAANLAGDVYVVQLGTVKEVVRRLFEGA